MTAWIKKLFDSRESNWRPVVLVLLVMIIFGIVQGHFQKVRSIEDINARKKIAKGVIAKYHAGYKSHPDEYEYFFLVNVDTFRSRSYAPFIKPKSFITLSFPVVYDSLNPSTNRLLLTPSDFETYDLQFPDSLKWVKYYLY